MWFTSLFFFFYSSLASAADIELYYPFNDPAVKLQQGWIYTYSTSNHLGIDYIKGTVDQSATWESFAVLLAADGSVTCDWSDSWGNYALGHHVRSDGSYYTVYAHLETCQASQGVVTAGSFIGTAGATGSDSNGVLHLHFELSLDGYGSQCGCKVDPYGIEQKRGFYPEYGGSCGVSGENYFTTCSPEYPISGNTAAAIDNSTTTSSERSSELAWLEDMDVLALNPYSGFTSNTTVSDMLGSVDIENNGALHLWYLGSDLFDEDGVHINAYVQDYTGGYSTDGAVLVYNDGAYAVPIWGDIWDLYIEQLDTSDWTITSNCSVDWFSGGTAYGPSSLLGLPTTSEYYVDDNDRWRQDFQRGYVSKDDSTSTIHVNCFSAFQSTSEPGSPGWSDWGWAGQLSSAVTEAWWRSGAEEIVGYPYDNGGGANLHIWGGVLIQDFTGEVNEDNAIIVNLYGLGEEYENDASVVRNGFWGYYKAYGGQAYFGAPLGDEMSLTYRRGSLHGYDPRCDVDATTASIVSDGFVDYEEREDCIDTYCGSTYNWQSMQRFENVTLCWSGSNVFCDPSWDNPYCPGSTYSPTEVCVSVEGDSWNAQMVVMDPDSGQYDFHVYYHNGDTDETLDQINAAYSLNESNMGDNFLDPVINDEAQTANKEKWLAGDVDDDGWTDIVMISHSSETLKVQVWVSNGDGTFQTRDKWYESSTMYDQYFLGEPGELLAGRWVEGDGMKWYTCHIDEGVDGTDACDYWGKLGTSADNAFVTGDFNGDGNTDIVAGYIASDSDVSCPISGHSHNRMRWRVKRGGSTSSGVWKDDWGCAYSDYLAGDMNGDGYDDLVQIRHDDSSTAPVFVALSDGSDFDNSSEWEDDLGSDNHRYWTFDVNGDGRDDMLTYLDDSSDNIYVRYSEGNDLSTLDRLASGVDKESGGAFRFGNFGHYTETYEECY